MSAMPAVGRDLGQRRAWQVQTRRETALDPVEEPDDQHQDNDQKNEFIHWNRSFPSILGRVLTDCEIASLLMGLRGWRRAGYPEGVPVLRARGADVASGVPRVVLGASGPASRQLSRRCPGTEGSWSRRRVGCSTSCPRGFGASVAPVIPKVSLLLLRIVTTERLSVVDIFSKHQTQTMRSPTAWPPGPS